MVTLVRGLRDVVDGVSQSTSVPWMIRFTSGEDCTAFLAEGFSAPEAGWVWMTGPESRLTLPPMDGHGDLLLHLVIGRPSTPKPITTQIAIIKICGQIVGRFRIDGRSLVSCRIPRSLLEPLQPFDVIIEHPCYLRVDLLGHGNDTRLLAISLLQICVTELKISPVAAAWLRHDEPTEQDVSAPWPELRRDGGADRPEPLTLRFARSSRAMELLEDGWVLDQDGMAMTGALANRIAIPAPVPAPDCMLRLGLQPLLVRSLLPQQRLTVIVNGAVVGQFTVRGDTELSMPLPSELWIDRTSIELVLLCPDAVALDRFNTDRPGQRVAFTLDWICIEPVPSHLGSLARRRTDELVSAAPMAKSAAFMLEALDDIDASVTRAVGVSIADMLRNFESLGNNCAFGLAQRKGGAEILGLLRFANTPFKSLVTALADSFAAVRNPASIDIRLADSGEPREFMAFIAQYGIRWHTMVHEDVAKLEDISAEQITKLVYLQRRFVSGLTANRKIYVFGNYDPDKVKIAAPSFDAPLVYEEDPGPMILAEAVSAFVQLNQLGRNTLLYVVPSRDGHRSGSAELVLPGVIRGYLDSFVISADTEIHDHADWLRLCANAWVLDNGANKSFRAG